MTGERTPQSRIFYDQVFNAEVDYVYRKNTDLNGVTNHAPIPMEIVKAAGIATDVVNMIMTKEVQVVIPVQREAHMLVA